MRKKNYAHLWDSTRCISCASCVLACTATNAPEMMLREERGWRSLASNIRRIETVSPQGRPELLLVQCMHCTSAPCVETCPFGAVKHDENGLVVLNPRFCAGCKYCVTSCPYNVRWMHPDNGLPKKCMGDGCLELLRKGERPACVQVCPAGARDFGDINDPTSSISKTLRTRRTKRLLDHLGTEPKYFVVVGP